MAIWAAIKKALNSDLTTPLNTQINNSETRINGLISNLNTNVSSRAPSSTALNTSQWTNARAGYLDNLNKSLFTAGSAIKSVQRGTSSIAASASNPSRTITISLVNAAKCVVILNSGGHQTISSSDTGGLYFVYLSSLSDTSLTVGIAQSYSNYSPTFSWQVIEFY